MPNIILCDDPQVRTNLLPLTFTRPISHLQVGILSIAEAWQKHIPGNYSYNTEPYLSSLFPLHTESTNLFIEANILPTLELANKICTLRPGEQLVDTHGVIARCGNITDSTFTTIEYHTEVDRIEHPYHIFMKCGKQIENDFKVITSRRVSTPLPASCTLIGDVNKLFIEEGAYVEGAALNTLGGPIYIGKNAEVMEGTCLRGPIAVCEKAHVNMGARIYGPTVIGKECKVGGEINNVVFHPYSNKAHDGFLGNAVIGSWCNLGAGCTASNLKNDYSEIKLWNYASRRFLRTGLQFCGLIMADHSKAGINTMFNTATVVGVGVNIHGTGFPRNFVASFSEGSATAGFTDVSLTKFFTVAQRVMARRGIELTDADRQMFTAIHEIAESYK